MTDVGKWWRTPVFWRTSFDFARCDNTKTKMSAYERGGYRARRYRLVEAGFERFSFGGGLSQVVEDNHDLPMVEGQHPLLECVVRLYIGVVVEGDGWKSQD